MGIIDFTTRTFNNSSEEIYEVIKFFHRVLVKISGTLILFIFTLTLPEVILLENGPVMNPPPIKSRGSKTLHLRKANTFCLTYYLVFIYVLF